MVKIVRVSKSVIYKRAEFSSNSHNLQAMLVSALSQKATVGEMKQKLGTGEEETRFRIVGETKVEQNGLVFGTLMSYKPGTAPVTVIDDNDAQTITMEKFAFPQEGDGKPRELLECVLFFGCLDNHLVLMQSYLKSQHLEEYFTWLLRDVAILQGSDTLALVDTPSQDLVEKLDNVPVRAIKIKDSLLPSSGSQTNDSSDDTLMIGNTHIPKTGILKALLGFMTDEQIAKLPLENLDDNNIEVSLLVRYNRKTTEDGQQILNTLGHTFRHTDNVDATIELENGGSINGQEVKLTGKVRANTYDGHPASNEVYDEMRKWLLEKINSSQIKPE